MDEALPEELLDSVKGVLEFERLNSVISGPYDRMLRAYNAVIREANTKGIRPSAALRSDAVPATEKKP